MINNVSIELKARIKPIVDGSKNQNGVDLLLLVIVVWMRLLAGGVVTHWWD